MKTLILRTPRLLVLLAGCVLLSQLTAIDQASAAAKTCDRAGYETFKKFPTAVVLRKATRPDPKLAQFLQEKRLNYTYVACSTSLKKVVKITSTPVDKFNRETFALTPTKFAVDGPFLRFTQQFGDNDDTMFLYWIVDLRTGKRTWLGTDSPGIPGYREGDTVTKFSAGNGFVVWSINSVGAGYGDQIYVWDGREIKLVASGKLTGTFTENPVADQPLANASISYILDGVTHTVRLDGAFTTCSVVQAYPACSSPYHVGGPPPPSV